MTKPPGKRTQPLLGTAEAPLRSRARKPRDPKQPVLPFDPMPGRVEPSLALLVSKPPKDLQWIYEVKWDGVSPSTSSQRKFGSSLAEVATAVAYCALQELAQTNDMKTTSSGLKLSAVSPGCYRRATRTSGAMVSLPLASDMNPSALID